MTTYQSKLDNGDGGRIVFSTYDIEQLTEAARLHDVAQAKDEANDAAFNAYITGHSRRRAGTETRSQRSLAASARNRDRAFQEAAGDADRAWFKVDNRMVDACPAMMDVAFDSSFTERAAAIRSLIADLQRDAVDLNELLGVAS